MADAIARMVLLPRYTALYGSGASYVHLTPPINVRTFAKVLLTAFRSTGLGLAPNQATVAFQLQQSTDLGTWFDVGSGFTPAAAGTEITVSRDFTLEWARVTVAVSISGGATTPGVTCWLVGSFVPRETVAGG